jgi:hypothetical protein
MQKSLFFLLLLLSPSHLFSQSDYLIQTRHKIDSLEKLLTDSEAKKQVDILNELASFYASEDFDSSIFYSSRAARLASNIGYQKGIGVARYQIGNAYYFRLDFKNALISYLSAQSILEKGVFNKELGDLNLMIGNINYFTWRGDKAIASYRKALGCYLAGRNERSLGSVFEAMSMTYYFLEYGPCDSSLIYGFKLLDHARRYKDRYREASILSNIGMFYTMESRSALIKQKAIVYCDSALEIATAINDLGLITITNVALGDFYNSTTPLFEQTGNLTRARYYYELAHKSDIENGNTYLQAAILNYLARIDIIEKKYHLAKIHLDTCEARLTDFFKDEWENTPASGIIINPLGKLMDYFLAKREMMNMYHFRYELALATGKADKAVNYLLLNFLYRDSLFYSQQGQQIGLMMAEDEAEKQQQKMQTLAKDNELSRLQLSRTRFILIGIGAGILLISLIFLLILQRKKLRAEQRSISMEQRLLRAQMNPHFIFNSLASIQNFVINENSDMASIYLSRFSQLVRNILDNSVEEYVPLEKEINTIENYLELQKVRYGGKFDFKITIDGKIDQENMMIPPMLAQPFIENAIEHGIRHRETPGHIDIRFHMQDGLIRFEVEDNGVGREKAHEIESKQHSRHRSMATSLTRDRLNTLNKKLKKKIRMEIIDLKDAEGHGCGTKVEFGVPVKWV